MQRLPDHSFRFSPRDLLAYLEGDFAAWCERNHAERSRNGGSGAQTAGDFTPDFPDEEMDLVIRRGLKHEAAHLALGGIRAPDAAAGAAVPEAPHEGGDVMNALRFR